MEEGKEEKKCKGVKKNVVRNKISFEDYKECLFNVGKKHAQKNEYVSQPATRYFHGKN
jgi:hypothetical protein